VSSNFVGSFDDGNKSRIISNRDQKKGQMPSRIMLRLISLKYNRKQRWLGKPETFLALAAEDAPPSALPPLPLPPVSSTSSPAVVGGEGKTVFAVVILCCGLSVGIGVWITATLTVILGGIFCVD
jgi:hypothetical protein